jgi:hypothetical protein
MSHLNLAVANSWRGFADLPPEIIEQIAEDVDPKDLLNLRLLSKYVAASTERPMLKANFEELQIILALPSSLRKALRVARSEKLRTRVSKVCIFVDRFHRTVLSTPSKLHPSPSEDGSLGDPKPKRLPMY